MTLEQQLLRLFLNYNFWKKHKHLFESQKHEKELHDLFEVLSLAHERFKKNLTPSELFEFYKIRHPTLTAAREEQISILINKLKNVTEIADDVADVILTAITKKQKAHAIAEEAIKVMDNPDSDFLELQRLIENNTIINQEFPNIETLDMDTEKILTEISTQGTYRFNIPELGTAITGIGPGNLIVIFARPEVGKTTFWISLCFNEGGFISQGAKLVALINEEPARRTFLRCVSAWTGMTQEEIFMDTKKAIEAFNPPFEQIALADCISLNMSTLDAYLEKHKPDIVVIDQLDKIRIHGTYAHEPEKLKAIYVAARELSKRHECIVFAITQASDLATNKSLISFEMMENSRTGKAAEADVVIGIGHNSEIQSEEQRTLCIGKNKISGVHGEVHCRIEANKARYMA